MCSLCKNKFYKHSNKKIHAEQNEKLQYLNIFEHFNHYPYVNFHNREVLYEINDKQYITNIKIYPNLV